MHQAGDRAKRLSRSVTEVETEASNTKKRIREELILLFEQHSRDKESIEQTVDELLESWQDNLDGLLESVKMKFLGQVHKESAASAERDWDAGMAELVDATALCELQTTFAWCCCFVVAKF